MPEGCGLLGLLSPSPSCESAGDPPASWRDKRAGVGRGTARRLRAAVQLTRRAPAPEKKVLKAFAEALLPQGHGLPGAGPRWVEVVEPLSSYMSNVPPRLRLAVRIALRGVRPQHLPAPLLAHVAGAPQASPRTHRGQDRRSSRAVPAAEDAGGAELRARRRGAEPAWHERALPACGRSPTGARRPAARPRRDGCARRGRALRRRDRRLGRRRSGRRAGAGRGRAVGDRARGRRLPRRVQLLDGPAAVDAPSLSRRRPHALRGTAGDPAAAGPLRRRHDGHQLRHLPAHPGRRAGRAGATTTASPGQRTWSASSSRSSATCS